MSDEPLRAMLSRAVDQLRAATELTMREVVGLRALPDEARTPEVCYALGVIEGRAELGDGETLWLECNAAELHGVSFGKGCYVGQENTARMNWRQKVNRRLLVVPLKNSDPARRRIAYPEFGLAVDHLRVDDIEPALIPEWLRLG